MREADVIQKIMREGVWKEDAKLDTRKLAGLSPEQQREIKRRIQERQKKKVAEAKSDATASFGLRWQKVEGYTAGATGGLARPRGRELSDRALALALEQDPNTRFDAAKRKKLNINIDFDTLRHTDFIQVGDVFFEPRELTADELSLLRRASSTDDAPARRASHKSGKNLKRRSTDRGGVKDNAELTPDELREVFNVFDKDGSGFISADEVRHLMAKLGEAMTDAQVDELISEADANGDGEISYAEFEKIMMVQGSLLKTAWQSAITRLQAKFRGKRERRATNKIIDEVIKQANAGV